MNMNMMRSLFVAAAILTLPASGMAQYHGGDVRDGGTISGTVKFKGTAPAPKKLDVRKDKEVCAKTPKIDQSLVVNNGNLANAVVTITDIKKGKNGRAQKSHPGPSTAASISPMWWLFPQAAPWRF